jgi:hypothetical protein
MELKVTKEWVTKKAMADLDELFEGEGKNIQPELRVMLTQAWISGFQSGFHAGFEEAGDVAEEAIKQISETVVKITRGGEQQ